MIGKRTGCVVCVLLIAAAFLPSVSGMDVGDASIQFDQVGGNVYVTDVQNFDWSIMFNGSTLTLSVDAELLYTDANNTSVNFKCYFLLAGHYFDGEGYSRYRCDSVENPDWPNATNSSVWPPNGYYSTVLTISWDNVQVGEMYSCHHVAGYFNDDNEFHIIADDWWWVTIVP